VHPKTEPKKLAPDVDIPVRPPRTGVNTATGVLLLFKENFFIFKKFFYQNYVLNFCSTNGMDSRCIFSSRKFFDFRHNGHSS